MKSFKLAAAAFGVLVTVMAASSNAHATTIVESEPVGFNEGRTSLNADSGSASTTISPNVAADTVIDGQVQIDATNIRYWWDGRDGQSGAEARIEQANSWNFTLTHAGKTADLGGLPGAVTDHWFKTTAFDGLAAGGDWILTATSDYYKSAKRMIAFDLAGFFFTNVGLTNGGNGGGGNGGGQVPAPGGLLLILAGLAGIASTRRKA